MNHKKTDKYTVIGKAQMDHTGSIDHLRVSTIRTAHRRPLNNNTANNNIKTTDY